MWPMLSERWTMYISIHCKCIFLYVFQNNNFNLVQVRSTCITATPTSNTHLEVHVLVYELTVLLISLHFLFTGSQFVKGIWGHWVDTIAYSVLMGMSSTTFCLIDTGLLRVLHTLWIRPRTFCSFHFLGQEGSMYGFIPF